MPTAHVKLDQRGRSAAIGAGFHGEKFIPLSVLRIGSKLLRYLRAAGLPAYYLSTMIKGRAKTAVLPTPRVATRRSFLARPRSVYNRDDLAGLLFCFRSGMGHYSDQSPWWNPWLYRTVVVLFLILAWKTIGVFREAWRRWRLWRRRRHQLEHLRKFGR
jgi:hypothetical protein